MLFRALLASLLAAVALPQAAMTLTPAEQQAALDLAVRLFKARSVDASRGPDVERLLQRRREAGEFAQPQDIAAFCAKLQADLMAVTHDPHGAVSPRGNARPVADPERAPESPQEAEANESKQRQEMAALGTQQNFGYVRVERLDGNVGYLRLDGCFPGSGPALAAALSFLQRTKALIIDLRENGGGDPDAGVQLAGCFLPQGNRLLATEHHRNGRIVRWQTPEHPVAHYVDLPVFVLTSARTFSAGESLAYDLQALKVAQVVGERTPGGAGTVTGLRIHPNILMGVSVSVCRSEITGGDFQGIGVQPDLPCAADQALTRGHVLALQAVLAKAPHGPDRDDAQQALDALQPAKNK
jgi:hypothetical protein